MNLSTDTKQTILPGIQPPRLPVIWSRRTLKAFLADLQGFLQLPPREKVWEWAATNIFLSAEITPEPGFYNPERIPYQKRLQDWMTDKRVNDIIGCTAAQLIKTTAMNNGVGYFIKADPSGILVVYPTIDDGKDWMREKFMPMVKSSPSLRKLIPDENTRVTGQTTLIKHFPGGRLQAMGANSPSSLRGRSFRIVIQDDLDGFKDNAEGDSSAQADKRAATQPRALRMKFSTPTLKGTSKIWKWLEQSTFDRLLCPCAKCDHPQTLEWEQVIFDPAVPEDARYKCIKCGDLWDDTARYVAVMEGCRRDLWQSLNPNSKIKGLHMNGLYRLMGEKNSMTGFLEEWVRDYLAAKAGGEKTYQVWVNTFLALTYEPASETIEPHVLFKRRENYKPTIILPEEILVVAAAVDVQGNRLECEVRGFGLGQESWGIEYREFSGDPTEEFVWKKLDAFLAQFYKHPIRGQLRIATCFVDAGGSKQSEAYIYTEKRNGRGIFACRGSKDRNAPALSPLKKAGYNQVPYYFVGVHSIKDTLHSRLRLREPGAGERSPGFLHWPKTDDYDETYFKNLTAEKRVKETKGRNKGEMVWKCAEGVRNEPWDINVYMIAALESAGYTEKSLRSIARDNARLREQMNLPPLPDRKVTTAQELMQPPAPAGLTNGPKLTKEDLAAAIAGQVAKQIDPATPAPDPNQGTPAPMSAPVVPLKKPGLKVWGKGRGGFPSSGNGPGFAMW